MPDNILRVGAEFDVGPIVASAKEASEAFQGMSQKATAAGEQTKASFQTVAQADASVVQQINKSSQESLAGFVNLKGGGILAFDALRAKLIETTSEVARLRQEILQTNDQATLAKLRAELQTATQQMTAARFEMRAVGFESRETTEKLNLLGESVGVKLPSAFSNLLGKMPAVQSAMAAAFQAGIVLFFIHMVGEAANKIAEFAEELGGFGKQAQKIYQEAVEENSKAIVKNIELHEKLAAVRLIGKEGTAKYTQENVNAKDSLSEMNTEITRVSKSIEETNQEIERLSKIKPFEAIALGGLPELNKQIEDLEASAKRAGSELETLKNKRDALRERAVRAPIEETERSRDDAIKTGEARLAASKEYGEALITYEVSEYHRRFQLGEISLEQEISLITSAENRKLEIQEEAFRKLRSLKESESRTAAGEPSGKNIGPALIAMDEKMSAARIASAKQVAEETARIDEEILTRDIANGEARIKIAHEVAAAVIKGEEEKAKRVFAKADSPAEIEQAATTVIEKNNKLYDDRIEKIKEEASLLISNKAPEVKAETGTPEFDQQVATLEKTKPEVYRQLIEMNAQIKVLLTERENSEVEVQMQAAEKTKAIRTREAADALIVIREQLTAEEAAYHENLSQAQILFEEKKISLGEYTAIAKMYAQEEYLERIATLEKEGEALKKQREADLITEERYNKEVEALRAQAAKFAEQREAEITRFVKEEALKREQALHQQVSRVADEFSTSINQMITHEKTFGQAMAQLGDKIALSLIDNGIKRVTIHYGEEFAKMLANHLGFITKFIADHSTFLATILGIETTNKAAKEIQAKADQAAQVTSDAGVSFAAGFASVMAALPFPENVATAPEVAATAASATIAGGFSFEKGGIMPEDHRQAFISPHEMVLPVGISKSLQGAVPAMKNFNTFMENKNSISSIDQRSSASTVSNKTQHNHFNIPLEIHNHGRELDADEVAKKVTKAIRANSLRIRP